MLVLGCYDTPHACGSSHGTSRISGLPCYEDPAYVPPLRHAYELWREAASGQELLVIIGSSDASPKWNPLFQSALASAHQHGLPNEVLTGAWDAPATSGILLERHTKESSRTAGGRPPGLFRAPTPAGTIHVIPR